MNLVHSDGEEFFPIDYRVYALETDGKTKNDHFWDIVLSAKHDKAIEAKTLLFDSWYASVINLKLVHRLVSLSRSEGYIHLQDIEWAEHRLRQGVLVKLKELPFKVLLFKLVATNGDIEWVITNHPEGTFTSVDIQNENAHRWQIEQLHRELKQLTGNEKCECHKARSQRNHLACCYFVWLTPNSRRSNLVNTLCRSIRFIF